MPVMMCTNTLKKNCIRETLNLLTCADSSTDHCESGEGPWLYGEAAIQTHSFRDTDPQEVIPPNEKKNYEISPKLLRPGINFHLNTTDSCLPNTALQCSDVYHFKSSQCVD